MARLVSDVWLVFTWFSDATVTTVAIETAAYNSRLLFKLIVFEYWLFGYRIGGYFKFMFLSSDSLHM